MSAIRVASVIQLVCAVAVVAFGTTGCTSLRRAPLENVSPQPPVWRVSPGDKVRVLMNDGQSAEFRVRTADAEAIIATDGVRYAMSDIATVERRKVSWLKTTALVAGIYGVIVVFAIAVGQALLIGNLG